MQQLRMLAWLVCGIYATIPIYWLMVHPFAALWRRRSHKMRVLVPLWILMWCAAWAASCPWRNTLLYNNPGTWVAAPLLWAVSAFMYVHGGRELTFMRLIGRHELDGQEQPTDNSPQSDSKQNVLVTFGVHRLVRHPIYLGHFCTMSGFVIGSGTVACLGLFGFAMIAGAVMVVYEERELHARFGPAWEEYCEHTPAIFPVPNLLGPDED